MGRIFIFLGILSFLIGFIFYSIGAQLILPFSLIEIIALTIAYFINAIHANDYERLKVDKENIYFESKYGAKYCDEKFLKSSARIFPSTQKNLVSLQQGDKNITFGHHIHISRRPILEKEIRQALMS
jgi:uncharacterized membrane protein